MGNGKKLVLIIMDVWGHGPKNDSNAIFKANTPFIDSLYSRYPNDELKTSGEDVGLPDGQMGNSDVGHITLYRNGEPCSCGSRGCVETYLSGPGLERRYRKVLAGTGSEPDSQLISGELITELAQQDHMPARQVLREAGEALGLAVAALSMILNIDLYVVGGSVSKAGDLLLAPAREIVPRYSFHSVSSGVQIVASTLGDDAPILGCGWQARSLSD